MKQPTNKDRLDNLLVVKGFYETKSRAQAAIMAGNIRVNGHPITKAGHQTPIDAELSIAGENLPYVSRGGLKLEKAIKAFQPEIEGRICLDAGASTGGFTDCLLQNGAKKVFAVDVGYGQLAWKLRSDDRVVTIERTNIRTAEKQAIYKYSEDLADLCVMDLSFISVTKVLENIKNLMNPEKIEILTLIKPQFEAGREQVPKSGVIRDKTVHVNVIKNVVDFACNIGLYPVNLTYSPIKGPAGNIEYLIHLKNNEDNKIIISDIEKTVNEANEQLTAH